MRIGGLIDLPLKDFDRVDDFDNDDDGDNNFVKHLIQIGRASCRERVSTVV